MVTKALNYPFFKALGIALQFSLQLLFFILLPVVVFTALTSRTDILGGFKSFVVLTGSMEPTLPVGSMIYTKQSIGYAKDDVIAFKNDADQTVTHRIADIKFQENTLYTTKGDANATNDATSITTDKVIGEVIFHIPYIGYFTNHLRTPRGFITFIIIPSVIFIVIELWNIKKEMEHQIEKRMFEKFQRQHQTL